jgi:DTW domain-containing protein
MKIYLLTHQRESNRPSNTGQLALTLFPDKVTRIIWNRVAANQELLQLANKNQIALIHPSGKPLSINNHSPSEQQFRRFVLIDATWQEAQKILNRTPFLKTLEAFALEPKHPSKYQLRRNQKECGLCTAECIAELFKTQGEIKNASLLLEQFDLFNQAT